MSTLLTKLAEWAVNLSLEDISPRVVERVRLQHLNLAATIRQQSEHPLTRALRAGGSGR